MVDVSDKAPTARTATAEGRLLCLPATLAAVQAGKAPNGPPTSFPFAIRCR
jgi:cyclic pyranopterin phosphate synthase